MRSRSDIHLGDLLRAVAALHLSSPEEIREAAALLGLSGGTPQGSADAEPQVEKGIEVPTAAQHGRPAAPRPRPGTGSFAGGQDLSVHFEGRSSVAPPVWAGRGRRLEVASGEDPLQKVEPPPLLNPPTSRALLVAVASRQAAYGPVHFEQAVAALARAQPLANIPRRVLPTLRFGIQVLVDYSPSMLPFRADQQQVVRDLRKLIGQERLQVLRFEGLPWRAGPGTPRTWRPYASPAPGTSVLLLSDLGLCRGDTLEEVVPLSGWTAFADRLLRSGCRVAALVPHGPRLWPSLLRLRMQLFHWDRTTTVAAARWARRKL